jgi:hypothetical protein
VKPRINISPGDIVRLRKKHPCGSDEWEVVRTGVDIRIKCLGCQRQVLLERTTLERKIKSLAPNSGPAINPDKAKTSG